MQSPPTLPPLPPKKRLGHVLAELKKNERFYSEITCSNLATFVVVFCRTFEQHERNRPCVSTIF